MSTITKPTGQVLISVEEFGRMQDAGLFEGRHGELLDGGLYEVTKNPPHNYAVDAPAAGAYPAPAILAETESVDLVIDGQKIGTITVAELLPQFEKGVTP